MVPPSFPSVNGSAHQGCWGRWLCWADVPPENMRRSLDFASCWASQVKLVQHTYSCLFGTFLCNNAKERGEQHTQERTCSVWSLLRAGNKAFRNLLYSSQSEAVRMLQSFCSQQQNKLGDGDTGDPLQQGILVVSA